MKFLLALFVVGISLRAQPTQAADIKSLILPHQALEAQGGERKLRSSKNVQWEASGYRN
ncbi:hypothetical protein [Acidicapsa ligni]|uniref:hypothetical protein n=1 Tax=Acidicapsa ligni TaxID=542300 RepID=UPI0021E0F762|nr:hypothetical protein [Acidicapsa ligni]